VVAGINDSLLVKQAMFLSYSMPERPMFTDFKVDSLGNLSLAWDKRFERPKVFFEKEQTQVLPSKWNSTADSVVYTILSATPNEEHKMIVAWKDSTLDSLSIPFFNEALDENFSLKPLLGKKQLVSKPLLLQGNPNVLVNDVSALSVVCDSALVPVTMETDTAIAGRFFLKGDWKSGKKYSATLLPGTFKNAGKGVNDTLKIEFQTYAPEDLGTLIIEWPDSAIQEGDVFVLTTGKLEEVARYPLNAGQTTLVLSSLEALDYRMFIWNDANRNSQWDTASFPKRIQAEKSWALPAKVNVRANWEIRQKWELTRE
jgi:hypothetical protein